VSMALAGAAAFSPEVVLVIGFPDDVVGILNGAAKIAAFDSALWFFTQGAKFPDLFSSLDDPSLIEGAQGTSPASAATSSEAYLWFGAQYAGAFQVDPKTIVDVANVFDAAMLLAVGASYALAPGRSLDGHHLAEALTHVSAVGSGKKVPLDPPNFGKATGELATADIDIEGASGHLDFDNDTGEAPADIEVWRVENGAFVTVKVVSP